MAKKKVKEIKKDYVREYLDYAEINKENLTIELLEEGIRVARKKQREYDAIGTSCMRLADNIELEFEFTDEEKIKECIKKTQRELGLLQDEEFHKEFSEFTPYKVESYHKLRKMILEEKRQYSAHYKKIGTAIMIGTINIEALAKYVAETVKSMDLDNLSSDVQTALFFHKHK